MLIQPEQVVAVSMHGGSLIGNLRRAGKKGMSRKRLMALALALGASAAAAGGVQHHRRAGQQAKLQHQLDGLTGGFGDWDAIAAQVAGELAGNDDFNSGMSETKKMTWLARQQAFQQSPEGQARALRLYRDRLMGDLR